MPTLRSMHDVLREEGSGPDDEESEPHTDTETNEGAEDSPRFSITVVIGALLRELAQNLVIIPPFLPLLLNHPSSHRKVVIGFRANPGVYTLTDVVVADTEPLNSQEANITQADNQMWEFFSAENNAMLGIVLGDLLRRNEDEIVESESEDEEEDLDSEPEEAQDDNAVVVTSTPEANVDPHAELHALERELDEVSDSEEEYTDEYTDTDEE